VFGTTWNANCTENTAGSIPKSHYFFIDLQTLGDHALHASELKVRSGFPWGKMTDVATHGPRVYVPLAFPARFMPIVSLNPCPCSQLTEHALKPDGTRGGKCVISHRSH
jgi:hypothetical protein